ncbi:CXD3 protein, partial [Atractosteus spatula]|nr:CXD3 protein [Atractosteus spatula]
MGEWAFLSTLFDSLQGQSPLLGRFWLLLMLVFRILILSTVASDMFEDEQEEFACNTLQPGCKQVCYDMAFPISHYRFWVFHIVLISTPSLLFLVYAAHLSSKGRGGGGAAGAELARETGRLRLLYLVNVGFRLLAEVGALVGQWWLYGFTLEAQFPCQRFPCPYTVDCFTSRPMEKTVFLRFYFTVGVVSALISLTELLQVSYKLARSSGQLGRRTCKRENLQNAAHEAAGQTLSPGLAGRASPQPRGSRKPDAHSGSVRSTASTRTCSSSKCKTHKGLASSLARELSSAPRWAGGGLCGPPSALDHSHAHHGVGRVQRHAGRSRRRPLGGAVGSALCALCFALRTPALRREQQGWVTGGCYSCPEPLLQQKVETVLDMMVSTSSPSDVVDKSREPSGAGGWRGPSSGDVGMSCSLGPASSSRPVTFPWGSCPGGAALFPPGSGRCDVTRRRGGARGAADVAWGRAVCAAAVSVLPDPSPVSLIPAANGREALQNPCAAAPLPPPPAPRLPMLSAQEEQTPHARKSTQEEADAHHPRLNFHQPRRQPSCCHVDGAKGAVVYVEIVVFAALRQKQTPSTKHPQSQRRVCQCVAATEPRQLGSEPSGRGVCSSVSGVGIAGRPGTDKSRDAKGPSPPGAEGRKVFVFRNSLACGRLPPPAKSRFLVL